MAAADEDKEAEEPAGGGNPSFGTIVLALVASAFGAFLGPVFGSAFKGPWYVSLGVSVFTLSMLGLYVYYWLLVRSAKSKVKRERNDYRGLRNSLTEGGAIGRFHKNRVDDLLRLSARVYGDAGEDAPNWTSQSFYRSLFIAVVYPTFILYLSWILSGKAGFAQESLGVESSSEAIVRASLLAAWLPLIGWVVWKRTYATHLGNNWTERLVFVLSMQTAAFSLIMTTRSFAVMAVIAFGTAFIRTASGVRLSPLHCAIYAALSLGLLNIYLWPSVRSPLGLAAIIGLISAFFGALGAWVLTVALKIKSRGVPSVFHCLFIASLILFLVLIWPLLAIDQSKTMREANAFILTFPLMALINAPFDWLSLGITRKLMRKGLGKANWQPLLYSFIDLILALACLVALGAAMILVIQTFNARLIMEGGSSIYDPAEVLRGIANPATRWESQYWWVYATLFSTFIPSFLNLIVGSLAIVRGIAPVNGWVLKQLPERAAVTRVSLWTVPFVLAFMRTATIALAGAALVGFVYVLAVWVLPIFGINLLEWLIALADADLPGRILIG